MVEIFATITNTSPQLSWNLFDDIAALFHYEFMVHAFEAGTIVAIVGGRDRLLRRAAQLGVCGARAVAHWLCGCDGCRCAGSEARSSACSHSRSAAASRSARSATGCGDGT